MAESKQDYVLIFARKKADPNSILLVQKKRPAWQSGKYNLVGGHVEAGEDFYTAAEREFLEETGIKIQSGILNYFGEISGDWGSIACYGVEVEHPELAPRNGEDEEVFWIDWTEVRSSEKLIPNLKVIIPLFLCGVQNWAITEDYEGNLLNVHVKVAK